MATRGVERRRQRLGGGFGGLKPFDRSRSDDGDGEIAFAPILKGLSLDIEPGQFIGVAGTTGAGKSTLVKLLLRRKQKHKLN